MRHQKNILTVKQQVCNDKVDKVSGNQISEMIDHNQQYSQNTKPPQNCSVSYLNSILLISNLYKV